MTILEKEILASKEDADFSIILKAIILHDKLSKIGLKKLLYRNISINFSVN